MKDLVIDGIRGMKEWQSEKVEEMGEYHTAGTSVSGFSGGKQQKTEDGKTKISCRSSHTHTGPEGLGFKSLFYGCL